MVIFSKMEIIPTMKIFPKMDIMSKNGDLSKRMDILPKNENVVENCEKILLSTQFVPWYCRRVCWHWYGTVSTYMN